MVASTFHARIISLTDLLSILELGNGIGLWDGREHPSRKVTRVKTISNEQPTQNVVGEGATSCRDFQIMISSLQAQLCLYCERWRVGVDFGRERNIEGIVMSCFSDWSECWSRSEVLFIFMNITYYLMTLNKLGAFCKQHNQYLSIIVSSSSFLLHWPLYLISSHPIQHWVSIPRTCISQSCPIKPMTPELN
jgi:hypothetical protein